MKPAWDQLIEAYQGNPASLVADVDCTTDGGKTLCEELGVGGYPTIKYGDPNDLQDYEGGRDFDSLKTFAEENLGPKCGPTNLELCDEAKKAEIAKLQAMTDAELEAAVAEKNGQIEKLEADFKEQVEGLQKQYSEANAKKDKDLEDVKNSGLGLMKSCIAKKQQEEKEEMARLRAMLYAEPAAVYGADDGKPLR